MCTNKSSQTASEHVSKWRQFHRIPTIHALYLHGEVMCAVVGQHIAHTLVQHGEERVEGTETGEVHDVLQLLAKLQALDDDAIQ